MGTTLPSRASARGKREREERRGEMIRIATALDVLEKVVLRVLVPLLVFF